MREILITLSPTATDADGDALAFSAIPAGCHPAAIQLLILAILEHHTVTVIVSDGSLTDTQDVAVTVIGGQTNTSVVDIRVSNSNDDAEEHDGIVDFASSDLELVDDGFGVQTIGIRFTGVNVPAGASITNAYVEFETDETDIGNTSLILHGESSSDAAPFTATAFDISNRTLVSSTVAWNNVSEWNTVNEKHQTPDISNIVQDIVEWR